MARKRPRPATSLPSRPQTIFTAGEVFTDGTLVELVRPAPNADLELLFWNGTRAIVGPTVTHDSRVYSPPELNSTILERVTLPIKPKPYGTAKKLLDGMSGEFARYLNISEDTARLFAYSSLTSWFSDCLDIAPCLSIASPAATESLAALRLLNCFFRHSLIVGEISQSGLQSLPSELHLGLLINEPSLSTKIQKLLNTSTCRGLSIPQSGKLIDLYGAKAIAGREHPRMLENLIRVAISPRHSSQLSLLSRHALETLTTEYQPKLLAYRLENLARVVAAAPGNAAAFTVPLLEVARNMGLCFPETERTELNDLLKGQDDEVRGERLVECPSVVLEVLLVLCHEPNRRSVTVEEITDLVNALLTGRGETNVLSWRAVGAQLKSLQLFTRRFSGGKNRGIHIDVNNRKKNTPTSHGLRCCFSRGSGRDSVFPVRARYMNFRLGRCTLWSLCTSFGEHDGTPNNKWGNLMSESQDKKQKLLAARDLLIRAGRLDSVNETTVMPLPILIEQSGGAAESMLVRISEGMTGCYFYVSCVTDAPRTYVSDVRLELPIANFDVHWLQENCRHQRNYWLGGDFCLPDDLVLNHKIPGTLYRGRAHEGWFVGLIQQPLPIARGRMTGKLILSDALGRSASAKVSLMLDPRILKKTVQKHRGGLFQRDETYLKKTAVKTHMTVVDRCKAPVQPRTGKRCSKSLRNVTEISREGT